AMVESLDGAVGRVLQTLEQEGLADRTLIVFTSDNGGRITKDTTSNAPLKYGKASAYEGGVRVPLIVRWPGVTKPDSIIDDPVISMDLFRTILEACDIPVPESETKTGRPGCDGLSLVPLLSNKPWTGHEELFWHYPHHQHYQRGGTMPYSAIRSGHLKLIEFLDDLHTELYDLRTDISESKDLAADQPDTVARLRDRLHAWRIEVGAQMPRLNPGYKPDRPQYDPGRPQPPAGQQP
ncbi:MAG: sulfatase-like hydrolase/transferase, partial [Planctomycetota bacterium]